MPKNKLLSFNRDEESCFWPCPDTLPFVRMSKRFRSVLEAYREVGVVCQPKVLITLPTHGPVLWQREMPPHSVLRYAAFTKDVRQMRQCIQDRLWGWCQPSLLHLADKTKPFRMAIRNIDFLSQWSDLLPFG